MLAGNFAAAENQNTGDQAKDRQKTAEANDFQNGGAVASGRRVVLVAEEQRAIDGRADFAGGGVHQPQTDVARRVLDTVEVTRDAAIRREQHNAGGVGEKIVFCIKREAEIGSAREGVNRFLRASQEMPAGGGLRTAE